MKPKNEPTPKLTTSQKKELKRRNYALREIGLKRESFHLRSQ